MNIFEPWVIIIYSVIELFLSSGPWLQVAGPGFAHETNIANPPGQLLMHAVMYVQSTIPAHYFLHLMIDYRQLTNPSISAIRP
jgi:hypothetical protein